MKNVAVIIPSYCPPHSLPSLCQSLRSEGFSYITVVNDGSPIIYDDIFRDVENDGSHVISSKENRGKGHAIKTGILASHGRFKDCSHFVFCDDDRQHCPADLANVARIAIEKNQYFVLGCRKFDSKTPWKSLVGNTFMSFFLRICHGISIADSQSGLRCFSKEIIELLLSIPNDRFGFEVKTIIALHRLGIQPLLVPIKTIYFAKNSGTRFRMIRDSIHVIKATLE